MCKLAQKPNRARPTDNLSTVSQRAAACAPLGAEKLIAEVSLLPAGKKKKKKNFFISQPNPGGRSSPLAEAAPGGGTPLGDLPLRVLERSEDASETRHAQQVQLPPVLRRET